MVGNDCSSYIFNRSFSGIYGKKDMLVFQLKQLSGVFEIFLAHAFIFIKYPNRIGIFQNIKRNFRIIIAGGKSGTIYQDTAGTP